MELFALVDGLEFRGKEKADGLDFREKEKARFSKNICGGLPRACQTSVTHRHTECRRRDAYLSS
jgi:hypothetical protein